MTLEELEKNIKESENNFRKSISMLNLSKIDIENRINKILVNESKDVQIITQLKYLEGLNIYEISKVLDRSIGEIYMYLQYIIFKVDLVLKNEKLNFTLDDYIKYTNKKF